MPVLSGLEKEILAVLLDMNAVDINKVNLTDVIKEVQRRKRNRDSGMMP